MNAMWGPALDAEVAYRAERLRAASRSAGAERRGLAGADERGTRTRARTAAGVRPGRGWHLPGSGAWHAAR
ncbi:hypothetical protein [Cellulomonas cellasea]|uniref:Uncharacterized protein n=1 Tax=Cellulomonas cellasea TaxID=43670 RepID=A0A7W4UJI5_9CELL|nr:hypothetical protein [Cellulomonas cellasea]MBB2924693.1 hypothetical protein [Cellulomonas cellasea]